MALKTVLLGSPPRLREGRAGAIAPERGKCGAGHAAPLRHFVTPLPDAGRGKGVGKALSLGETMAPSSRELSRRLAAVTEGAGEGSFRHGACGRKRGSRRLWRMKRAEAFRSGRKMRGSAKARSIFRAPQGVRAVPPPSVREARALRISQPSTWPAQCPAGPAW